MRSYFLQQFADILILSSAQLRIETDGLTIQSGLYDLLQSIESTAADKQNVGGIDLNQLLMRMLSASLWRYACHSTLDDF